MKKKLFNYIGLILLIAIIGIFIHSEIIGHCYDNTSNERYDYCNLVSNTIHPQQNEIQKIIFVFYAVLPSIDSFHISGNRKLVSFDIPYTPAKCISRIILFESFLI
jgi:hypothetical protein